MKLYERKRDDVTISYHFYCPGCMRGHSYPVSQKYYELRFVEGPIWHFNGNLDQPTFTPSLRMFYTDPVTEREHTTCHLFLTDGKIQFCSDSKHELAGQTVDLVDFPEGYILPQ